MKKKCRKKNKGGERGFEFENQLAHRAETYVINFVYRGIGQVPDQCLANLSLGHIWLNSTCL